MLLLLLVEVFACSRVMFRDEGLIIGLDLEEVEARIERREHRCQ